MSPVAGFIIFLTFVHASTSLKCYQCQRPSGDCIDNQCTGVWCAAVVTTDGIAGTQKIEKACSDTNPANTPGDACVKEQQGTTLITKCGCKSDEFCNSEAVLARMMSSSAGLVPQQRPNFVLNPVIPDNNASLVPRFPPVVNANLFPPQQPDLNQQGFRPQSPPQQPVFINNGGVSPAAVEPPIESPVTKNLTTMPDHGTPGQAMFTCLCQGPAYCENGRCKDEFCSEIEIDSRDMAHQSPTDPQSNVAQPNAMIVHKGCMKSNGLAPGQQLVANKIYPRVAYQLIMDGKPVRVNSNQKFCQGDLCNFAFVGKLPATVLTSCLLFLVFFY